ncbi:1-acyl-sn-glycerol-3-phosphate acyltransferase [Synechococcus sp. CBW1004]|nr:1-acyl-sn-glycerol-3-phosphate acyltransferase [Synechococcus sp. CBW1004]
MVAEEDRKPSYVRRKPLKPDPFQLDKAQLKALKQKIDLSKAAPGFLDYAFDFHALKVTGIEKLPKTGKPIIFVCNHTGTPLIANACAVPETVLLLSHVLHHYRRKTVRPLMGLEYYQDELAFVRHRQIFEPLGCVPLTLENGIQLLDMDEDVLMYPEGEDSVPPYQTRPFFWGFAKMAWIAEALIVPVAVLGPHESRLRIDVNRGPIVFVTPINNPNKVSYHIAFLPAFDVRHYVPKLADVDKLSAFCQRVRRAIQVTLDGEALNRPMVETARQLQVRHGMSTGRVDRSQIDGSSPSSVASGDPATDPDG